MKLYADPSVLEVVCPACGAPKGVWCGFQTAHERRIKKAEGKA